MKQAMRQIGAITDTATTETDTRSLHDAPPIFEEVRVSESDGFSSFQERDVVTFDEPEAIRVFEDMLREADELPGVANSVGPEYDIEIHFEDGETDRYYLWLNDDPKSVSSLYDADDTNIGYRLPADVTEELINLLEAGD